MSGEPEARIPLSDSWWLWPVAGLRSAGMPAERVLGLADPAAGDGEGVRAALAAVVQDPWFREALTWQNRELIRYWVGDYAKRLAAGDATLHRRSHREGILARYVQRYATKNETIGFFGPVGWARLERAAPAPLDPGPTAGERYRRSYFESRALAELAARWQADPELRAHLCPCRDLSARLTPDTLVRVRRKPVPLTADEHAVLSHSDGTAPPAQILKRLKAERPDLGFESVDEVLSILAKLARGGLLAWGLRLPVDERAEEHLARQLAEVPGEVGQRYRRLLDSLVSLRGPVDQAAGDPDRLANALDAVADRYHELSGGPGRRTNQERRTGREILWTDALLDADVVIGAPALAALGRPLELLLDICRWLTWRIAEGIAGEVTRRVRDRGPQDFSVLIAELAPELTGAPGSTLDRVIAQMRATVAELLGLPATVRELRVSTERFSADWQAAFAAPGPGWAAARMHSPDVMLATPGRDAAGAGDYRWIIGEIHVAVNTLDNRCFVVNQARPGQVERLFRASTPGQRYVPAFPRHWPDIDSRTYPPLTVQVPDRLVYWAIDPDDVMPLELPRLACAGLEVTLRDGAPVVTDRQQLAVPFAEFAGELLSFLVGNAFTPFGPERHTPRVVMDDVVVQRETWHLPVGELLGAIGPDTPPARLADLLAGYSVPRFVFVRAPGDPKPVYCDLSSTLLLKNVIRILRRSEDGDCVVRVQEMLPAFPDLWLETPRGRHTSELRLVAVDTLGWPG